MSTNNVTALSLAHRGVDCKAYEKMGCHAVTRTDENGQMHEFYRFRVWAPRAAAVFVTGDFNSWGNSVPMHCVDEDGVWETEIEKLPFLRDSRFNRYSYRMLTEHGELLKADPYAVSFVPPGTASRAEPLETYSWRDHGWMRYRARRKEDAPLNIYEVHLGSWRRRDDGSAFSYASVASELACYVKQMGYTHIKLLPVMEHISYDSLGFGTSGYYAPTSRYGTPKDFMGFVDIMHEAGVGVILDWLPTRFAADSQALREFDGEPLYERGAPQNGVCRFDASRDEVLSFVLSNLSFWVEKYHVDGFCVCDADGDDKLLLDTICRLVNENYADVLLLSEYAHEGFLFVDKRASSSMRAYTALDPIYRKYHHDMLAMCRVPYGQPTVSTVSRRPVDGEDGVLPGDQWQRIATLKTAYGFLMTRGGGKLMLMGSELGQPNTVNYRGQLDWSLLERDGHARLQLFVAKMNHLYLSCSAFWRDDLCGATELICEDDPERSISVDCRTDADGNALLVLVNFTPTVYRDYKIAVPTVGVYEEILNSDDLLFGGSDVKNREALVAEDPNDPTIRITVPPLAVCIFRQKNTARPKTHPLCFPMTQYK